MVYDLVCLRCIHFREFENGCDAFPEGIPKEIAETGESQHAEPLPGQENNLVFTPIDEETDTNE